MHIQNEDGNGKMIHTSKQGDNITFFGLILAVLKDHYNVDNFPVCKVVFKPSKRLIICL